MNLNNVVVAVNTASNAAKISKVLRFIAKYPSEEGIMAAKSCKKSFISSFFLVLLFVVPFMIVSLLYLGKSQYMPDGAVDSQGVYLSKDNTISLVIDREKVEYKISDYTDKKYSEGDFFYAYLNENNELIDIMYYNEYLAVFFMFGILVVPIAGIFVYVFVARKTTGKWMRLYTAWYEYEIEPLELESNFHELVKDKKYYNVLVKTSELAAQDRKLFKKYNGLAIFGGLSFISNMVICVTINVLLSFIYGLEKYDIIGWTLLGILTIVSIIFTIYFSKKARKVKEAYIKKPRPNDILSE